MLKRLLLLFALAMLTLPVGAQQDVIEPVTELVNPSANISFPPPVYLMRGDVEIRGTANLPDQANYFLEFRPLEILTEETDEARPWFPATLPESDPVTEDVLGIWNTRTAPDGLYELRLTINIAGSVPQFFRVSPLRIENDPPDFVQVPTIQPVLALPTSTAVINVPSRPTLVPTPTPLQRDPQVTALTDANVRQGDDVSYPVVGSLLAGETLPVIGISSYGTGWFYVELPNGRRGFIAPSVVRPEGDVYSTQRVNPPRTPTPSPTNTPIFTATPTSAANLHFVRLDLRPSSPRCGETFQVIIGIENNGTTATTSSGTLSITDVHVGTNSSTETTIGGFPVLQPGEVFTAEIPITVGTFFDEEHDIRVTIDSGQQVPELNEGDNVATRRYTLEKGNCG